jgi:3'-phosphoadenosine 5'-phosphosulfate sulfotransferase (PAPS reductase)/FAD synthetase
VREDFPDILAVYVDTGLEYPSVKKFVKSFDNVKIIRPEMSFKEVINKYGYPILSKESASRIHYARRALKLGD